MFIIFNHAQKIEFFIDINNKQKEVPNISHKGTLTIFYLVLNYELILETALYLDFMRFVYSKENCFYEAQINNENEVPFND